MADLNDLHKKLGRMGNRSLDVMMARLLSVAETVRGEAVKSIQQSKPSHPVTRRGKPHNAANAGNPPNTDTGNLVKNIKTERRGLDTVVVGSFEEAPYGKWLEVGNEKGQRWEWLKPAYRKTEPTLKKKLEGMGIELVLKT